MTTDPFKKKVSSVIDGNPPIGVNLTKPASQDVIAGAPDNEWVFKKVGDAYHLSINGYLFTGVVDDKVVVSNNPDDNVLWKLTFSERQISYVIARADDPSVGWSIFPGLHHVHIKKIIVGLSAPPTYLTSQLFKLEPGIY